MNLRIKTLSLYFNLKDAAWLSYQTQTPFSAENFSFSSEQYVLHVNIQTNNKMNYK